MVGGGEADSEKRAPKDGWTYVGGRCRTSAISVSGSAARPYGGLIGRDRELAELAEFCTAADRGPYVWWQAPAWAGKTALMASFVLAPPPGVRIVSFFITARLAGQNEQAAFFASVLEQLAVVLGQSIPAVPPASIRDMYLLEMLAGAAQLCQGQP